jgi:hypothetical protein
MNLWWHQQHIPHEFVVEYFGPLSIILMHFLCVQAKAEKILAKAREEANRINSIALEETEKAIADAYTRAERVIRWICIRNRFLLISNQFENLHREEKTLQEQLLKQKSLVCVCVCLLVCLLVKMKAEIEETKKKELAEITDRVQHMIAVGELPTMEHRGVVQRMKASFVCYG